jgi:hypothetical protein
MLPLLRFVGQNPNQPSSPESWEIRLSDRGKPLEPQCYIMARKCTSQPREAQVIFLVSSSGGGLFGRPTTRRSLGTLLIHTDNIYTDNLMCEGNFRGYFLQLRPKKVDSGRIRLPR